MTPTPFKMMDCPNRHGRMNLLRRTRTVVLGCNVWDYDTDVYACPVCDIEIEAAEKAAEIKSNVS